MPVDRTMTIQMGINASQANDGTYTATASYNVTNTNPSAPTSIMAPNGDIDLTVWTGYDPNQFTENVDMTFNLDTNANVTLPGGGQTEIPVLFATKYGPAVTIAGPNLSEVSWTLTNGNSLFVDDNDNDSNDYTYCPAIELQIPGRDVYFITLDPVIKNKPV